MDRKFHCQLNSRTHFIESRLKTAAFSHDAVEPFLDKMLSRGIGYARFLPQQVHLRVRTKASFSALNSQTFAIGSQHFHNWRNRVCPVPLKLASQHFCQQWLHSASKNQLSHTPNTKTYNLPKQPHSSYLRLLPTPHFKLRIATSRG